MFHTKYTSLSDNGTHWAEAEGTSDSADVDRATYHGPLIGFQMTLFSFVIFIVGVGIGVFYSTFAAHRSSQCLHSSRDQTEHDNTAASPIWNDGINKLPASWTRYNGSLYSTNNYRGPPSPALDAAWDRFTDNEFMPGTPVILGVSLPELHRSQNDFSAATVVRLEQDNGGGGFMSSIEVFHQLHCLNVLRKWTHFEHYQEIDEFWQESNRFHLRDHTDHCIDILRQVLMCQSDTGLVPFHWTKAVGAPIPYFSTSHRCRDPEQVLAWAQSIAKPVRRHIYKTGKELELEDFPS